MTISVFVMNLWENSSDFTARMDIETARQDLDTFRAEGWDMPDDITPEDYMEVWNELVDEYCKDDCMVINRNGASVNYEAAVQLMDDEIRESLAAGGYGSEQDFFTAYEQAHEKKFGSEWELSKANPVW